MNIRKIVAEEFRRIKESRADQLRRELDNAVNGTDYGYTPKDTGEDPTTARGRGLEIDDELPKKQSEETLPPEEETLPPEIEYWTNGNKKLVIYRNSAGKLHRTDGPAYETFYENGKVERRQFYIDGKLHRTDDPAFESFYKNGRVECRQFRIDGKYHRTDGSAVEYFYENGKVRAREFWIEGKELTEKEFEKATKKLNRDETAERFANLEVDDDPVKNQTEETLPPEIRYWTNGKKKSVTYRNSKGQVHRIGGPAIEEFYDNGKVSRRLYYVNGNYHRTDGPAYETFDEYGEPIEQYFFINDRHMNKKDFKKAVENLNREETAERFAALEVDDELPREQPEEDNEMLGSKERSLKNWKKLQQSQAKPDERFAALEVEPPKERNEYKFTKNHKPESDPRFKKLELDENMKRIRMHFKRLLGNNKC